MHLYFLAKFTKYFRQVKQVKVSKLDVVGPVDNRPSTNKLHHFFEKNEEKKIKNKK